MAVDLTNFREDSKSGNIVIQKVGEAFVTVQTQFNPNTGQRTAPIVEALDRAMVEFQREQTLKILAEMDAVLATLDELDSPPTKKKPAAGA